MPLPALGALARGNHERGEDDGGDTDRHVDEEDPVPAAVGDEQAAEGGADGCGGRAQGAPEADGHALLAPGNAPSRIGQRDREQGGAAQRLSGAEGDQPVDVGRESAEQREDGEGDEAEDEDALLAELVADAAHREEGTASRPGCRRSAPKRLW